MAWATVAAIALSVISSVASANSKQKANIEEANILAANKARETKLKAAALQNSFLSSGLGLEGTPMSAIMDTYDVGLKDINHIRSNADAQSKSLMYNLTFPFLSNGGGEALMGGASSLFGSLGGSATPQTTDALGNAVTKVNPTTTVY